MNRILTYLILAVIQFMPATAYSQVPDRDRLVISFRYLTEQGDWPSASKLLNSMPQGWFERNDILESLTLFYLNQGDYRSAQTSATKLVEFDPALGYWLLAKISSREGDHEFAIRYLMNHLGQQNHFSEKQIKLDEDFLNYDNNRLWISLWQRNWYAPWESSLAELEYQFDRTDPATFEQMITGFSAQYPEVEGGWFLYAKVLYQSGNQRKAIERLNQAARLGWENKQFLHSMLPFLIAHQNWDIALTILQRLGELDPTEPQFVIQRALVNLLSDKTEEARQDLNYLSDIGVRSADLWYEAAQSLSQSDPADALQYINRALDAGAFGAKYYNSRASLFHQLRRDKEALADYGMSLDINALQPDVWFNRAEIRHSLGDSVGACHDWTRALRLKHRKAADRLAQYCR